MNDEELYMFLCQYPSFALTSLRERLNGEELDEAFLRKFLPVMRNGELSAIDMVPSHYFVENPTQFRQDWWGDSTIHWDTLENKDFLNMFKITQEQIFSLAFYWGREFTDMSLVPMDFIKNNLKESWMEVLMSALPQDVLTNVKIETGFNFTAAGLKNIAKIWKFYGFESRQQTAIGDMIIRDAVFHGEEIELEALLTFGVQRGELLSELITDQVPLTLTGANCFTLADTFKFITRPVWVKCVEWFDKCGALTAPLFESILEDIGFDAEELHQLEKLAHKFGIQIKSRIDSDFE